jgi:hypothetical protein
VIRRGRLSSALIDSEVGIWGVVGDGFCPECAVERNSHHGGSNDAFGTHPTVWNGEWDQNTYVGPRPAFSFKGKRVDVREIGAKLRAELVLEGTVRKFGVRFVRLFLPHTGY